MIAYRPALDVWENSCQKLINPPQGVPLPWWPKLTESFMGIRPHEFTLLCAPTGAGKTTLMSQISAQLFDSEVPQYVAPVETGDADYMIRVISALENRKLRAMVPMSMDYLERMTLKYAAKFQKNTLHISTHDNRVKVEDMIGQLEFAHQSDGIKVAILDNLNFFLKPTSQQNALMEMDEAVHAFVMLALRRLPIHIILIVHPKKTDNGRVLSEFDIKGSSTAVQEATNVILFNRPDQKEVDSGRRRITDRELVFRKNRENGECVGKPIWFTFDGQRYRECQ